MSGKSRRGKGGRGLLPVPLAWLGRHAHLTAPVGVLLVVVAAVSYGVWNRFGKEVTEHARYWIDVQTIEVTEPPSWLVSNVPDDVMRLAGLPETLNSLDAGVSERIADAYRLHPWVRRVNSVQLLATNRAVVDLEYHRPVCMVEVEGGFLPVDGDAMLLPTVGVAPEEAARFARFAGVRSDPAGPVGSSWGDEEVQDAARIARALAREWQGLNFRRMRVRSGSRKSASSGRAEYEIETRDGVRVIWGHAPGAEVPGESSADEKKAKLVAWRADAGEVEAGEVIDVRRKSESVVRTVGHR